MVPICWSVGSLEGFLFYSEVFCFLRLFKRWLARPWVDKKRPLWVLPWNWSLDALRHLCISKSNKAMQFGWPERGSFALRRCYRVLIYLKTRFILETIRWHAETDSEYYLVRLWCKDMLHNSRLRKLSTFSSLTGSYSLFVWSRSSKFVLKNVLKLTPWFLTERNCCMCDHLRIVVQSLHIPLTSRNIEYA